MTKYVLAIDQGTTSSRAILFDENLNINSIGQEEFPQHYPISGWVEHDPEDLWNSTVSACRMALTKALANTADIVAVGITNQRETTLVWDRETGIPIYNAIVWQDRRTAELCSSLKAAGHEEMVTQKTGLLLDPYFSGSKISWLLDNVEGARQKADLGKLAFGTVDSFLLWRFTNGKAHVTDATNASRTMLYDIRQGDWSDDLLQLFRAPRSMMPDVYDCTSNFAKIDANIFGKEMQVSGVAGDQQAATIGQACFEPGMMKSTYGTGCFALMNTGETPVHSNNRILTTVAYRLKGKTTYALEGSIFIAGAAVQWLRDALGLIKTAQHSSELAAIADDTQNVILVPAFVGLGAPYWDADCRGAIFGLTRNSGPAELSRAVLESVCYQTRDLMDAMIKDWGTKAKTVLRVDGGMVVSDWTMQRLSDLLNASVDRPKILETTALGAAYLAGMHHDFYPEPETFSKQWSRDRRFTPQMSAIKREEKYMAWKNAVSRTLS